MPNETREDEMCAVAVAAGYPTTCGGVQRRKLSSEHVTRRAHIFFARFGTDLHARSVLSDKNFCIGAQEEVYQECIAGWAHIFS